MADSQFIYVTYIRTTAEKLWQALTEPEFTRQYWCNTTQESEWKPEASWRIVTPDGRTADSGEIIAVEPQKRMVLTWRHELDDDLRAEGYSRLTYDLEQNGEAVKLTVTHEMDMKESELIKAVSSGWPPILSSLKSLLETGQSLEATRRWPEDM
ncbi:MAG: SRPBCC family protein [Terracidiphilus sp.]